MFQTKLVDKIKTHFMWSVTFFFNRTVYEIMRENVPRARQVTHDIRRMRNACWVPKATNTHTQFALKLTAFSTATMVAGTRLNITSHVRCLSYYHFVDTFHPSHRLQAGLANPWISLARRIRRCPSLYSFRLPDPRSYVVKNMCIYTRIWPRDCIWITVATK